MYHPLYKNLKLYHYLYTRARIKEQILLYVKTMTVVNGTITFKNNHKQKTQAIINLSNQAGVQNGSRKIFSNR